MTLHLASTGMGKRSRMPREEALPRELSKSLPSCLVFGICYSGAHGIIWSVRPWKSVAKSGVEVSRI